MKHVGHVIVSLSQLAQVGCTKGSLFAMKPMWQAGSSLGLAAQVML